jgi:translation elongation factor EF-1alpha
MSWFDGPTVLQALDTFEPLKVEEKPLRFPIQDIYSIDGKKILVGRIEAGRFKREESLFLLPEKKIVVVKTIEKFLKNDVVTAGFEESIGICLKGKHRVGRGHILAGDLSSMISDSIRANIFWMDSRAHQKGETLLFRCVTQEIPCQIEKIYKKFDPASMELIEEEASSISSAEVADVMIHLKGQAVVDPFNDIPEMGRFVLEKDGRPVAGGVIL